MEGDALDLNFVLKRSHSLISTHAKEANEIIAFIGNTGSGKSTLVKFLTKDKTLKIEENAQEECIFVDTGKTISGVGAESFESKTLLPNVTKDEESGCTIVDCAGFNDTRSCEMDFVAAFMNNEYLKMAKRIKIVIVENNSNLLLSENRVSFKKNLLQLSELLKLNHSPLQKSICLIANKVDSRKSDEKVISGVHSFLGELQAFLSEKDVPETALKILSYLQEGRVGILRRPLKLADDPWDSEDLKQNYIDLRKLIFEDMQFADDACDKFNVTVAQETRLWINCSLIDQSYNDLKTSMRPIIKKLEENINEKLHCVGGRLVESIVCIISVGKQIIRELSQIKSEEDVISVGCNYARPDEVEELEFCLMKTKFIYKAIGKNEEKIRDLIVGLSGRRNTFIQYVSGVIDFNEFLFDFIEEALRYENLVKSHEILEHINALDNVLDAVRFKYELSTRFSSIGFDKSIAMRAIQLKKISPDQVDEFKHYLKNILDDRLYITFEGNVFFVRGKFIILSQQLGSLNEARGNISQIVLAATQRIIIDCDLTLESTHLVLISPLIEIVNEKRTVKLLGESGVRHAELIARASENDAPGADGLDGNPGFSSGSCKIIALEVRNPELLAIVSQGGDGGDGQDGGDGFSSPCNFPEMDRWEFYIKFNEKFDVSNFVRRVEPQFHSVRHIEDVEDHFQIRFEVHPDPTIRPSNGGRGGNAGHAAAAGEVDLKNELALNKVAVSRQNGTNGTVGKGGSGGESRGLFRECLCYAQPEETSTGVKIARGLGIGAAIAGATVGAFIGTPYLLAAAAIAEIGTVATAGVAATAGLGTAAVSTVASLIPSKKWIAKVVRRIDSGFCQCIIPETEDGEDGRPANDDPDLRYKFTSELLSLEEIINAFEAYSVDDGYDYQKLIQYLQI